MIISFKDLYNRINLFWPGIKRDIWLMDGKFYCPTMNELINSLNKLKEIRESINNCLYDKYNYTAIPFINYVHDCDNFALEMQADFSRFRMQLDGDSYEYPYAFGSVSCERFKGIDKNHTINICYTSDIGFVMIEPQDFTYWKADNTKDKPYFIEMR